MYYCHRCGREVSAMEAVLHPPKNPDQDNIVLCPICAVSIDQSRINVTRENWRKFWYVVAICISLVVVWSVLIVLTASTWEVFAVFSAWVIGVYFNRKKSFTPSLPEWSLAVVFTIFVILVREWILLSLVAAASINVDDRNYFSLPIANVWRIFVVQISINPTLIFLWIISIGIAGLTASRHRRH